MNLKHDVCLEKKTQEFSSVETENDEVCCKLQLWKYVP